MPLGRRIPVGIFRPAAPTGIVFIGKGLVLILQKDSRRSAFEILILIAAQGPKKRPKTERAQNQGGRNQNEQGIHQAFPCRISRRALSVTRIDEPDMAMAAIRGVTRPAAARGTAQTL